jgi:hypothetical protein
LTENADILKQSKVKESKVKESKEDICIPFEEIQKIYNDKCSLLPKATLLSDKRKTSIKNRFIAYKDISIFETLFTKAAASKFLNGDNNNNWTANFDWLLNENNMIKVLEGNYDNKNYSSGGKKIEKLQRT